MFGIKSYKEKEIEKLEKLAKEIGIQLEDLKKPEVLIPEPLNRNLELESIRVRIFDLEDRIYKIEKILKNETQTKKAKE